MKYLLIVLLFVCSNSFAQCNSNNDNVFVIAGSSIFCGKELQFNAGVGKYIFGSFSAIVAEYQFMKENYTIVPTRFSQSHTLKLSYLYSFNFCSPLYLNAGFSTLAGHEKTFDRRAFMLASRVFLQSEARICKFLSLYFEPAITYRFRGIVKSQTNITVSAGVKVYMNN